MKTMKIATIATIITIIIITLCGVATANAEDRGEYYPKLTTVISVEEIGNIHLITCEDGEGNRWEFFDDENFWKVGDFANLLMWNMGETEEDDEIVEVYYEGHIEK